jgi:hypothetical protein
MITYNQNIKKENDCGYGFYVDLEEPNNHRQFLSKYKEKIINLPTICEETLPISIEETNIKQNIYIEQILIIIFIFINIKLFLL